jgi:hypothetical protein
MKEKKCLSSWGIKLIWHNFMGDKTHLAQKGASISTIQQILSTLYPYLNTALRPALAENDKAGATTGVAVSNEARC